MFDGFTLEQVDTGEASLRVRYGGDGPPLLLHGHPQTHVCWHRVAPRLAEDFTGVCADLRGYGGLECVHHLAEEAPGETYKELHAFFSGGV